MCQGVHKHQPVTILIDSRSTDNFLAARMAKKLKYSIEHGFEFEVKVADGRSLVCSGKCANIEISWQDSEVSTNLFILPLDDLLLGARWLRTLGDITWNFSQLAMHFIVDGNQVTIKGKGGSTVTTVSNHHMEKILKKEIYAYLMQLKEDRGSNVCYFYTLKNGHSLIRIP